MIETALLQVRPDGFELKDLLYVLFVLVLPALSSLGKWIRDRSGRQTTGPKPSEPREALRPPRSSGQLVLPLPVAPAVKPEPVQVLLRGKRPREPVSLPQARKPRSARPSSGRPAVASRSKPLQPSAREKTGGVRGELMEFESPVALGASVASVGGDWSTLTVPELRRAIVLNEVLGLPIALRRGA